MTEEIAFQNGFVCGMATRGLVQTRTAYEPTIYNDEGVYTYFYLDFKRGVTPFSIGMFNLSMIVHDSEQLEVSHIEYVSTGLYKVWCDIANKIHGITLINKVTTLLSFLNGDPIPSFSVHMYIDGIDMYENLQYMYDPVEWDDYPVNTLGDITESYDDIALFDDVEFEEIYDDETYATPCPQGSIVETPSVALI